MAVTVYEYEAQYDARVMALANAATLRQRAWDWGLYVFKTGMLLAVFSFVSVAIFLRAEQSFVAEATLAVLVLNILFALGWTLVVRTAEAERTNSEWKGHVWKCKMTDDAWHYVSLDGVATSIPWSQMRLEKQFEGGLLISYGAPSQPLVVYTQPLIDRDLKDEFLSRISKRI